MLIECYAMYDSAVDSCVSPEMSFHAIVCVLKQLPGEGIG